MYKLKDIMEMLAIPERTIRRHVKLGLLKGEKVGGTWRFTDEDIEDYFSNKIIASSQAHATAKKVFDFLNGMSNEDETLIIKHLPKLSLKAKKELSLYVSSLGNPMFFNLSRKFGKEVIVFIGGNLDSVKVMDKIESYNITK